MTQYTRYVGVQVEIKQWQLGPRVIRQVLTSSHGRDNRAFLQ